MGAWTEADLAAAALRRLGVLASGQSATAEDAADVIASWESIHQNLRTEGLAPFAVNSIPVEAQHAVSHIVADANAGDFGVTGDRALLLQKDAADGMSTLRREYTAPTKRLPVHARYF
jgi:hypothetical protein